VQDGIRKLLEGLTALSELQRVIELPYQLASTPNKNQSAKADTPLAESSDDDFLSHVV
jgi:hypothetical protein